MKRCIICGNIGDENSTVCEKCGNPYVDISETVSAAAEAENVQAEAAEAPAESQAEEAPAEEASASEPAPQIVQGAGRTPEAARPARRVRSGPQIYGQEGQAPAGAPYGRQGMVRRSVQGGRPMNRPANADQMAGAAQPAAPAAQPVNVGQPMNAGRPGNPQGRPAAPGPQGRPMNPGQMQGRPAPAPGMGARPAAAGFLPRQRMETARKMLRSPLFLLIAVLHTAYLAGSVAAVFLHQMNYSQVVRLINSFELPSQVSGYANTVVALLSKLDSGMLFANIALRIPDLLFCLGLWMIFFLAVTAKENMSGAGFGFVKATVIINMVISCLVMLVLLIVSVAVLIASWVSGTMSMIVISAVLLVLIITVCMMVIMYYFCYLATLKTCRLNGDEGESYGRVSGYVAGIHILLALTGVVNLLSGIVNSEIANIVAGAGSIGWMLLFAVWIFLYRGKMDEIEA